MQKHCLFAIRIAWRHAWRRPFQSVFFILGVALGVAMIVAIDLANSAAQNAFSFGTAAVVGKATHHILGGPSGLDETVYLRLRRELGYRLSAPIVEDYVQAEELDARPMHLIGVDTFAEALFRGYLSQGTADRSTFSAFMVQPRTTLIGETLATQYGLSRGDVIKIRVGGKYETLTVVGVLKPEPPPFTSPLTKGGKRAPPFTSPLTKGGERGVRRSLDSLLITDIATAQEALDKIGRLDRIDLIIPKGDTGEVVLEQVAAILPPGARIETPEGRRGAVDEMTAAFRLNLTALSLLALVVGMFLIYNTVAFSVVQRRPTIASLRALGMTRREVFATILVEAGMLGIIGAVIGLGVGRLMAYGAVQMVTASVNDLYFVTTVREVNFSAFTFVKGAITGIGAALVAAMLPAYEATVVPPAGALRRSSIEERTQTALPWVSAIALTALVVGAAFLIPAWHLSLTFAGVFAILVGIALLTPVLTMALMRLLGTATRRKSQNSPRTGLRFFIHMASMDIARALSRTAVAVAALMVAISVIIGVGLMVGSFRLTVKDWLTDLLQADIFISPPTLISSRATGSLSAGVLERLDTFPGVARVATSRTVEVNTRTFGVIQLVAVNTDISDGKRGYKAAVGNPQETWRALEAGGLIINEPMANRFGLSVGGEISLQTDRGYRAFPIVGIAYDFDVQPGALINDAVYRSLWDDTKVSSAALRLSPSADVDATIARLRTAFAGEAELVIRSNKALRENSLAVFDRTFSITVALQMLATVVAFIGVLSSLMSLQLERSRHIGTLRAIGMTRGQLWALSMMETGLMGATAGLIAQPTGFVLAAILIYIINLRSFGWTLQLALLPGIFLQAFFVALVAALLAGLYPAWRMGKLPPAEVLRME